MRLMKRTTIMLPDDVEARLRVDAASRGISLAEAVREAIERGLESRPRQRRRTLSFVGAGEGPGDLAERADDYLGQIYDERHERRQGSWAERTTPSRPDPAD
jgi:plasmid stability protein